MNDSVLAPSSLNQGTEDTVISGNQSETENSIWSVLIFVSCFKAKSCMSRMELVVKEVKQSTEKFQFLLYFLKMFTGISYIWPLTALLFFPPFCI